MSITPEQLLTVHLFAQQVAKMDEAQTKENLVEIRQQLMQMDNFYRQRIARKWRFDSL